MQVWRDTGTTQDGFGAHVEDWTLQGSRFAHLDAGKGRESFRDEAEREKQPVVILLPYDELTRTLTPKDRLRYLDEAVVPAVGYEYDIQSVSDRGGRHEDIWIEALFRSPEADRLP